MTFAVIVRFYNQSNQYCKKVILMKIQELWEEHLKQRRLNAKEWVHKQYDRHIRNDFQWLDSDAAHKYHKIFMETNRDATSQRRLADELMKIYGVTDIEAINILHGRNVGDYISKYERIKDRIPVNIKKLVDMEDER
jgi:hypothetical protein